LTYRDKKIKTTKSPPFLNKESKMDRVTKSFLTSFSKSFGFEEIKNESTLFEHFTNYTIVEPKTEYHFDLESINIGIDGTIGIDGFALLLNNQFINTKDELIDFLDHHKKCTAEVVFIQSKTSKNFESKSINGFGFAVGDFISESQDLKWSDIAIEKIELFELFVSRISELKDNPICSLYYVTLGRKADDQNLIAAIDSLKKSIEQENLFSDLRIELVGAPDLHKRFKKIGQSIEKSFEFPSRVSLPEIEDVQEAYIGIINASDIINLMTDDDENLLTNVFYDNVRDYQGGNRVNKEIASTLESKDKEAFVILNNGITIVSESISFTRNNVTISSYQIINGCQTSHVLYENKDNVDQTVKVPVKLIVSHNEDLTSSVIRSTNRQTEVKESDLLAFTSFQKQLEDYYSTFKGDQRLYYERRSKQYNSKSIEKKRLIDKTTQIKAIASLYYEKPDMATRYFGALFSEFGDQLFKDNHQMYPYYVASFSIYMIDSLLRKKKIDKKYRKIKYHILTMLRREIHTSKCPVFESKKSVTYCEKIMTILSDEKELIKITTRITKKIDSLEFDLDDNEVSKSKDFVKKCLALYH
jgi:hypothetical protein